MKPITTFLCAVLLTIASQVTGQNMSTSLTAVPLPGQPPYPVGSQVKINLNVTNFTNISSVLLPITYNSAVLRFDSIDQPVMPGYIDTTLAFHPTAGVVKIAWFPSLIDYPNGFSVSGTNARLLTLRFTVIGNGISNVNVSTTVPFTPIEVINAAGNVVYNNTIFTSSGSNNNGASITGGSGAPPPPPLVGFKIVGTDVYARQGNRVCVPVTVNDFDNIQLLQYAMHWDNTKLTYDCVRGAANPIVPTFNAPAAAPGTLLLQWEDPNLLSGTGVTKADGARIYEVCFNTIGAPGTESTITFDGFGFGFPPDFTTQFAEATNSSGMNVWTTGGVNGASGVSSKVYIMSNPPGGTPVTYTADQDVVASGGQTCVDVKVANFTNITESEFLFTYDATKLTFVSPVTIPVTALNLQASNVVHSVASGVGTVKFKWSNSAGVSVADNTTIFSVCFTAAGAPGDIIPINFGTSACPNPTPFATLKKDVGGVPYLMNNGQVMISAASNPVATGTSPSCNTGATGSIALEPNGTATGYLWSYNGATTQNLSNLPAGTYTVTVTYSGGSTKTATAMLTAPPAISMTQTATPVNCFGDSNGAINITPSGGTSPYTYSWAGPTSFSATTQNISGVKTGNYVVTITDNKGCQFVSAAVNVASPQAISVPSNGISITNLSCVGSNNGAVSIAPQGGTTPYTYDWSNDGPENPDNDPQNVTGLLVGTITVTITDAHGCSFTPSSFTVSQPTAIAPALVKKDDVKCQGTSTGRIEINAPGGTGNKTYSWRSMPSNVQVGAVTTVPVNDALPPGTYNVIVTDANGCTGTLATNVVVNDAPSAMTVSNATTPGLCFGQATGSIDLTVTGGWGGYTYAWPSPMPAIQDPAPVSSGTYTVTVTDSGNCTSTQAVVVAGAQTAISIGSPTVSNVSCFGAGNGGVCLSLSGGNGGPYTVAWGNASLSGACIGNLAGGAYTPTVTDAQQCTAVFAPITVTEPTQIQLDTNLTVANPTGSIDLIVSGGAPQYSYSWSNSATSEDLLGVAPGTYTVTVTDANGCSKIAVYSVVSANVLANNVTVTSVSHSCNNDGCINLSIGASAAAASPFTITWNGGALPPTSSLSPSICGLAGGSYIVTVTAANGNSTTATATVNQLQSALLSTSSTNQPFDNLLNGSISIVAQFPNCTFLWGNGSTASMLSSLDSGTYVVTVTNNTSGCTAVYTYHLDRQYLPYSFSITNQLNSTCASAHNGLIAILVQGGNGPNYTYQWSGPNGFVNTGKDISNLYPGDYYLTVTDESLIQRTHGPITVGTSSNLDITNVNELSLTPGGTQVSGANTCDGVASVVFSGAVGITSIAWSNGITTATNSSLCGGAYTVTVTDSQGCTDVWSDALTAPEAITSSNTAIAPKCAGDANGSAKVYVTGGIEPYDVLWSNGQHDQLVFSNIYSEAVNLAGGTYTVTITDANDVTSTKTVIVPAPTPISVIFSDVDPTNFNSCDAEKLAFVVGAAEPIMYTWSGSFGHNGESARAEGLCAGEAVQFIILDANGCSATALDTVPYPPDGCFHVRPVLTPAEQDGNNDYTYITCVETVKDNVEIYNRWGQLVFQTEEYSNDPTDPTHTWTGYTRSGAPLPEGVYFYVLTFIDDNGVQRQFKGPINLLK